MKKKQLNNDVILADMHDNGIRFNECLKSKKEEKENQKQKIEKLKEK
ncbi:hypothetical protein J8281_07595 [Aquimarina sp. U1-2]|nr:hypothetical protein [Aquimarina sp. U1-2]MBP2832052.1 hypothetical protein [Aquimarina sp. U1-2]